MKELDEAVLMYFGSQGRLGFWLSGYSFFFMIILVFKQFPETFMSLNLLFSLLHFSCFLKAYSCNES